MRIERHGDIFNCGKIRVIQTRTPPRSQAILNDWVKTDTPNEPQSDPDGGGNDDRLAQKRDLVIVVGASENISQSLGGSKRTNTVRLIVRKRDRKRK